MRFQRALLAWTACVCLVLASLFIWSCNTAPADENTITLNLDSSRVGKFDSVLVEIFQRRRARGRGHDPPSCSPKP